MSDLLKNLRDLAAFAHADLSVADEAADEIERLLANAKQDAEYLAAYHYWCQQHDCAPSSSDLITSREAYISVRAKIGEKKND